MQADTATWDVGGASPTAPVAGSGNWTATDVNWSDGVADHTWTNGDLAIFGANGAGGTVTVGDNFTVSGITFNTNYTLSQAITLTLTNSGVITADALTTNVIGQYFGGNIGFTKEGAAGFSSISAATTVHRTGRHQQRHDIGRRQRHPGIFLR